jgi:Fur family transcriptional regulator, peroxide stress response regulator
MPGEAFRDLCAAHGMAVTHQRQIIWETLMQLEGHPSPEEVYDRVRSQVPSIALGTIYKNLRTFIEHGLISEVSLHHGSARLETNMHPHHHVVCTRCRAIVDLDETDLEPVRLKKGAPDGFLIHRYSVEVHGLCSRCARQAR